MSGDKINIYGKSYYATSNSSTNNNTTAQMIIDGLFGSPSSPASDKGVTATQVEGVASITSAVGTFLSDPTRDDAVNTTVPKAFINYVFFDEQFNYAGGGFSKVGTTAGLKDHSSELQNIAVPKNGYVYIYIYLMKVP
jgi:hypothetical protein